MKNIILKFIYFVLASYARRVVKMHKPFVIGITGSVGKSTTKEMIYQVMRDHFGNIVRANYGNLNAEIGIPLSILGYEELPNKLAWPFFLVHAYFRSLEKSYPKYLVLEMGVEHPGDLQYFSTIVRPDIGIITSAAPAHTANFPSVQAHQAEKKEMARIIKEGGTLIVNADDTLLSRIEHKNIITVGIKDQNAQFRANNIKKTSFGTEYRVETLGQKISVKSKLLGEHFIYSALFAFAAGNHFGIQSLEIKRSVEKVSPQAGRMNLISGRDGITILDDTYNASPASMRAALDVLSGFSQRRVAIIGNMNELGDIEKKAHIEIANYAKDRCDKVVFVGKNANLMRETYGPEALSFEKRADLENVLNSIISPRDVVLVKASQNGNFLEEIVKLLLKNKSDATKIIVRQSRFWLKKKRIK